MFADHAQADDTRFSDLKSDSKEIKDDIKIIKENHLAHIQKDIADIKLRLAYYTGAVVVALGIFKLFFK